MLKKCIFLSTFALVTGGVSKILILVLKVDTWCQFWAISKVLNSQYFLIPLICTVGLQLDNYET